MSRFPAEPLLGEIWKGGNLPPGNWLLVEDSHLHGPNSQPVLVWVQLNPFKKHFCYRNDTFGIYESGWLGSATLVVPNMLGKEKMNFQEAPEFAPIELKWDF